MISRTTALARTFLASSALVFATLSPATAFADDMAPMVAATTGEAAPLAELISQVDIPYEKFTLDNGLTVIVHQDRKAPIVAVSVWYDVGSKHEPKGKTGYAHLFEHIMFNGSENASGDYFTYTKKIGATDLNGTTWLDRTNYFQTVPKSALEAALFLESDRMGHLQSAIDQAKLDNQIGVVQNEKRQGDNQPYGLVSYKQTEMLFPADHPYGHDTIGSLEDLSAASLDDMKTWFSDHYGPNNAILVLAGDIDTAEARPLVEKWFGDIPRGKQVEPVVAPIVTLDAPKKLVMKDKVPTTRIYKFWAVPGLNDPEFTPLRVGASVFGGLASSRLDNQLVREEKTAVRVSTSLQPFVNGSIFEIQADVKPGEDPAAVGARIDQLLAHLIEYGPSQDEVNRVATSEAASRIAGLEQVGGFGGKAVALAQGELFSDDPEYYKKELARLAVTTPQQVTAAMSKWLSRPVSEIWVVPGEREAYGEVAGGTGQRTGSIDAPAYYIQPGATAPNGLDRAANVRASAPMQAPKSFLDGDRTTFPAVGAVPDLDFPDVETVELSNGIKVYFAHRDAVPVVRITMSFDAGYAADPRGALGTASMMTAMLDEGTTSLGSVELAETKERLGASINAGSSLDRTTIGVRALKPNLAPTIALMADIVKNPAFDATELERVRTQQLNRIASENSQPVGLALRSLPPMLYGNAHPYGVPFTGSGTPEAVQAMSRADLVAFHDAWMHPAKAAIFVVGDTTIGEVVPMLEASFGNWQGKSAAAPAKNFSGAIPAAQGRIIVIHRANSPQSLILAGEVANAKGTDDLFALNAANEVLGGDFLSRINMDLREDKGWAYGAFTFTQRPQDRIPFFAYAPVQTNRTGDSVKVLIDQIKAFNTTSGVTPEELQRTVVGNTLTLAGEYEQSSAVLGEMQSDVLYGRPFDYAETIADRYKALKADEMNAAIREAVDPDKLTWLIVGDAEKIKDQLSGLGMPVEYRGYDAVDADGE